MTVYVLIEHDFHEPAQGILENHAIGIYADKAKAQECADEYNKIFAPWRYSVERAEVIE